MTIRPPQTGTLAITPTVQPLTPSSNIVPFFRHNWREPVEVTSTWEVFESKATYTLSSQRVSYKTRPRRTVNSLHTALNADEIYQLLQYQTSSSPTHIVTAGGDPSQGLYRSWVGALYCDEVVITGLTDNGGGSWTLACNLRDGYRYSTGARLFMFGDSPVNVTPTVQMMGALGDITSVNVAFITATFPTDFVPEVGMCVVPAMSCMPVFDSEIQGVGSDAAEFHMDAREYSGVSALLPTSYNLGGGVPKYDGIEIFEPDHNWAKPLSWVQRRAGTAASGPKGNVNYLEGGHPLYQSSFSLLATRLDFFGVLRMFDSLRGGLLPMWVVTDEPISDGKEPIVVPAGNTITFPNVRALRPFRAIALTPVDGSASDVRRVTATTSTTITTDTAMTAGTYHACIAYLGKFEKPSLTEVWHTGDIVECGFSTVELDEEQDLAI